MNTNFIKTLEDVQNLLSQATCLEPGCESKDECYRWIELTLSHFKYRSLGKADKGLICCYLTIASGYSMAQVTRLTNQYISKGNVSRHQCTTRGFQVRYTKADIRLLAETDRLHSDLNGHAIKKICERAYRQGDGRYERLEFHSDNGSEFINHNVAKLLNKLNIHLSKSRSRHSNDNALLESKNGSVIRKLLGHAHIPQHHPEQFNQFDQDCLTPYLNYHRPCFYPETQTDAKGKEKKVYRYENMKTPYEKFLSLEKPEQYLKEGVTLNQLKDKAEAMTDNEAARQLQRARETLFQTV